MHAPNISVIYIYLLFILIEIFSDELIRILNLSKRKNKKQSFHLNESPIKKETCLRKKHAKSNSVNANRAREDNYLKSCNYEILANLISNDLNYS